MVGRYCCWLVNDGILYTDIYVLFEDRHAFFYFLQLSKIICFGTSLTPQISQSYRCFKLANMVANTSHARHWAESKYCAFSEGGHY